MATICTPKKPPNKSAHIGTVSIIPLKGLVEDGFVNVEVIQGTVKLVPFVAIAILGEETLSRACSLLLGEKNLRGGFYKSKEMRDWEVR
jgi:hypothetical protein